MTNNNQREITLTRILSGELFRALGFNRGGFLSKTLSPLVRNPIRRFAEIAVGFDNRVTNLGFQAASRWIMPNFAKDVIAIGAETIPRHGPLLVTSNHPGAYDSLVIASNLPRDDIKIVVNLPLDFISELPSTLHHFLYAPFDPHVRMGVVRSAISHLKNGGSLLIFASGRIDPDPACMPDAEKELEYWSRSLEIMIRQVPSTNLLITIVSGILAPRYVNHVLTKFRRERPDKQRISEFMQVINQMLSPGKLLQAPTVSFAKPIPAFNLLKAGKSTDIMQYLVSQAKKLLAEHVDSGQCSVNMG